MKCPHCTKTSKALVCETRASDDTIYRRRGCGHCGRFFVTREEAPPGLRMPTEHNNRPAAKNRAAKTKPIRATGSHLHDIW